MPSSDLNSFLGYIDYWADQTPESPAWWLASKNLEFQPISWYQLRLELLDTISDLAEFNLPSHSRVITCDRSSLQWALVDLACHALNWIHVPLDTRLSDSTKRNICDRSNPSLLVTLENDQAFAFLDQASPNTTRTRVMWHRLPACKWTTTGWKPKPQSGAFACAVNAPHPDSVATILFTSGSTSAPKGVKLTHQNLLSNARAKLDAMPQLVSDRRLNILPFSHAYARTCELSTWLVSGSSMMTLKSIDELLEVAPKFEPTLLNGVPYVFEKIRASVIQNKSIHRSIQKDQPDVDNNNREGLHQAMGKNLRMLAAGGAGLDEATFHWFSGCGYPIYQGYGLTEAGPVICSNRFPNPSSNHVGFPVMVTEVRIDESQRLFAKGPGIMIGYDEDEKVTQEKFRDGWLDTGDLAEWTAEGAVRILGRADDRITLATGFKVDPFPIEQKIAMSLGVERCMLTLNDSQRLVLIIPSNQPNLQPHETFLGVKEAMIDNPSYAIPSELIIVQDDWNEATGMVNAKGSLQRARIHSRYFGGIK